MASIGYHLGKVIQLVGKVSAGSRCSGGCIIAETYPVYSGENVSTSHINRGSICLFVKSLRTVAALKCTNILQAPDYIS